MCKNCECHEYLNSRGLGFNGDYRDKGHWCMYMIKLKAPDNIIFSIVNKKYITTKEFKQTPQWCPKKLKTYLVEDIQCDVIAIKSNIL